MAASSVNWLTSATVLHVRVSLRRFGDGRLRGTREARCKRYEVGTGASHFLLEGSVILSRSTALLLSHHQASTSSGTSIEHDSRSCQVPQVARGAHVRAGSIGFASKAACHRLLADGRILELPCRRLISRAERSPDRFIAREGYEWMTDRWQIDDNRGRDRLTAIRHPAVTVPAHDRLHGTARPVAHR